MHPQNSGYTQLVPSGTWPVTLVRCSRSTNPIPGDAIRLILFDLDGTLVDSRLDLANSVNGMLRHFNRPELPRE